MENVLKYHIAIDNFDAEVLSCLGRVPVPVSELVTTIWESPLYDTYLTILNKSKQVFESVAKINHIWYEIYNEVPIWCDENGFSLCPKALKKVNYWVEPK